MSTLLSHIRALWGITLTGLVLGAGLPALFALGVRWWSATAVVEAGGSVRRSPVAWVGACVCLVAVLAVTVAGVLYVAREFLADRLGIHLFGA